MVCILQESKDFFIHMKILQYYIIHSTIRFKLLYYTTGTIPSGAQDNDYPMTNMKSHAMLNEIQQHYERFNI